MAGLTQTQTPSERLFDNKAKKNNGESRREDRAVYVRYKDHVLFKNVVNPVEVAMERETIGWLTKQDSEIMWIEHDRTSPNLQLPMGQKSGLIILKRCIIEIQELQLQKSSHCNLNSPKTTNVAEYALQSTKRKTQSKQNRTGANK